MTQVSGNSALRTRRRSALPKWLPNMDLNHDKQIQSLLCYHYTIRQAFGRKESSRFQPSVKLNKPISAISNQWRSDQEATDYWSLITDGWPFVISH